MVELLSPVGDFECLKAAVQNGADCVYFGATSFSARASASNFNLDNLEKAIEYAKLRGVRTNLTLNTLIKDDEFKEAYHLAKKAYEFGIDAIIVQDLGLGLQLIKDFPDLPIHASTQMSVHNLEGVLKLQELGFKRVVLARELSAEEIEHICKNSNIEIECFIHGALCICYSGQCLFSSMIGGRSGNRGKCAQPCRLPYTLIDNKDNCLDKGYILSTRDLFGLEYLPSLIKAGVTSFKIEGRMKTPEYVAVATKIYRKYIDLALSGNNFVIDNQDRKDLLQVFNRGLSSTGHLGKDENTNLIYKKKQNNMGLPLGVVQKYNKNKGYITLKLKENLQIGDTISLEKENGNYTISELINASRKQENIAFGIPNQTVIIGRMKGNIHLGDNVYKMSSKELTKNALNSLNEENKKISLNAKITIKRNLPISIQVTNSSVVDLYKDLHLTYSISEFPVEAKTKPLEIDTVREKISKTGNTLFKFSKIDVDLDENIFVPKLSLLNELRRNILEMVQDYAIKMIKRKSSQSDLLKTNSTFSEGSSLQISVLLNILNIDLDYSKLEKLDNIYIPLKYFSNKKYSNILEILGNKFDLYIYLPTIIKPHYRNLFHNNIEQAIQTYNVKGIILSNISNLVLIEDIYKKFRDIELIANYTFNIFNNYTINVLNEIGFSKYIVSPELDKNSIIKLGNNYCKKELIVYGKIPVMNINYCLLGKTNKCYPKCDAKCIKNDNSYFLKDRLNMNFEILPDNIQTVTTIYNCKNLSILPSDFNIDSARIDILHEDIYKINNIIETVKNNKRFQEKITF